MPNDTKTSNAFTYRGKPMPDVHVPVTPSGEVDWTDEIDSIGRTQHVTVSSIYHVQRRFADNVAGEWLVTVNGELIDSRMTLQAAFMAVQQDINAVSHGMAWAA